MDGEDLRGRGRSERQALHSDRWWLCRGDRWAYMLLSPILASVRRQNDLGLNFLELTLVQAGLNFIT